jgi:hypothetical protein
MSYTNIDIIKKFWGNDFYNGVCLEKNELGDFVEKTDTIDFSIKFADAQINSAIRKTYPNKVKVFNPAIQDTVDIEANYDTLLTYISTVYSLVSMLGNKPNLAKGQVDFVMEHMATARDNLVGLMNGSIRIDKINSIINQINEL